jgi:hypothetical protein|eukprot:COSAG02_NODE_1294_length_13401_cov_32.784393_4_plen_63_part_00
MGALQLDCLPSQADSSRDLNLLTIPGDMTQSSIVAHTDLVTSVHRPLLQRASDFVYIPKAAL